ncbi:MAG TPA: DegT/DnrJ/EryC1/StrS aminotransferase [Lentisphaeria bacterium]|nr:DegT/DnrJ/EryC1/StrS aminotransferase [Lentisphaeria bacterium]
MKNTFLHEEETKKELSEFILRTNRLSMGIMCTGFESAFAKFQKAGHAILFNSGASANLAILQSLKNLGRLKDGDKIGFSALTWSTNVMPIMQLGFNPIPIDCAVHTLNVMAETLIARLKETRIQALFITNALGFAGDLDKIKALCEDEGIMLIEDNCEALGTQIKTGKTGTFGIASSFSFFVAHHMSTIEGGMICTNDDELAEMARMVRANGWDRNLSPEQQMRWRKSNKVLNEYYSKYVFYDLAYNLRPTEITGFLGLTQIKYLKDNIRKRQKNYLKLESVVSKNPDLVSIDTSHLKLISNFAFPVICRTKEIKEKYLIRFFESEIEIRPVIAGNIQRQPFYKKYVNKEYKLPGTDFIHFCGFYCGNYPELTEDELGIIARCLAK